jgi:hypothetical protein
MLGLRLTLSNISSAPIQSACLGVSRKFQFITVPLAVRRGQQPIAETGSMVDHPYCTSPLALGAQERTEWREEIEVPDVGAGEVDVTVGVQVVYGRDCDQYGCYDTMVSAKPLRLTLLP